MTKGLLTEISPAAEIAKQNNEAACHIHSGEYSKAIISLSSALVTIRDGPLLRPGDDDGEEAATHTTTPCHFQKREAETSPLEECTQLDDRGVMTSDTDECYFLCRAPVRVFSKVATSQAVAYAIIYNLALCHHLEALSSKLDQDDDRRALNLQRATVFYNHAQGLNFQHKLDILHSLTISNNLGHAHHFLNNHLTADQCFERLLNAIVFISESGQDCRQILETNGFCLEGFLINVTHLIIGSSVTAAAA